MMQWFLIWAKFGVDDPVNERGKKLVVRVDVEI